MTLSCVHPLAVTGLSKRYGAIVAVDDLDLVVRGGSIWGLVGPNGSGKTTALACIVGLVAADSGELFVNGESGASLDARSRLAFVPDEPHGLDELTVVEYLDLFRSLHRAGRPYAIRSERLLELLGLAERRGALLGALSRGMRRQVSLIAALALAPPLLVVDEATAALDPEAVIVLREGLRAAAAQGCGALLATQDLHFAERVCDGVTLLSHGRTLATGPLATVLETFGAESLEQAFLAAVGEPELAHEVREALDAR